MAANQLLLAPCTLSAVFAWNLALMDKADQIPDKLQRDLLPTMMNGETLAAGARVLQGA